MAEASESFLVLYEMSKSPISSLWDFHLIERGNK